LLTQLVLASVLSTRSVPARLPTVTAMVMMGYLASLFGWLPPAVGSIRFELAGLGGLALYAWIANRFAPPLEGVPTIQSLHSVE
jgi:hypothetical protein